MLAQYSKEERTGDGSVSWEKGARCVIPKVEIGGKGDQKQYSGKNLFDIERRTERAFVNSDGMNTTPRDLDENSYFVGIAANNYYLPENVSNFEITHNPVTMSFDIAGVGYGIGAPFRLIPGKTYSATAKGSNTRLGAGFYDENGQYLSHIYYPFFTVPNNAYWTMVVCTGNSIGRVEMYDIQVEEGTTATEYEPYTGGIPAPNPNYPIIPVFSERTTFVSRGRNLFDIERRTERAFVNSSGVNTAPRDFDEKSYFMGITGNNYYYPYQIREWQITNSPLTISLDAENAGYGIGLAFMVTPGKTYTPSVEGDNANLAIAFYDKDGVWLEWDRAQMKPVVVPNNACWMSVIVRGISKGAVRAYNIQIEQGTTATPYSPYFDGGTAVAPELLAIPGTEYRDTWDTQTGKGVRRCAVIESYNGEEVTTPFISSTGQLTEGAYVVYGIPGEPFQTEPQPLIQPPGAGNIIQTGGTLEDCPITVTPVTHQ